MPDDHTNDTLATSRILFVVNVDWFFLSHRLPLAIGAQQAGAEVYVAATDTGRSDEIRKHGLRFLPISIARNRGRVRDEVETILTLSRTYRNVSPDVVHHVTIKPVLYGSIVAGIYRIPTVNAISGFGHTFGVERNRLAHVLVESFYRIALRNKRSFTIFQNEEDRREFTSRGVVAESRAVLIHGSGVNCEAFRPPPVPPSDQIVMFASRMLREKGVEDFVQVARELQVYYPAVRFVLVGGPDDSPSSVSIEELKEWNDEGIVEWWGHSDDMEVVLPMASVVVLPTYYREGLPKVLLEAAACGIAMITTDVPGCRDIVRDGLTGILVAPHDTRMLSRAIRELLDNDDYRVRLGVQARALAKEAFAIEGVVEQTLALYRNLLQS